MKAVAAPGQSNVRDIIERLETRLARVESAFDTNTSIFSDGFKNLEMRQGVILRILHDVLNGQVRVKGVISNDDGVARAFVDVEGYTQEFLDVLAENEQVEEKAGPGPILHTLDDESPTVFGGDATP